MVLSNPAESLPRGQMTGLIRSTSLPQIGEARSASRARFGRTTACRLPPTGGRTPPQQERGGEQQCQRERRVGFGEIFDENVAKKLVECLEEEEFKAELKYHEGTESAYLHDDRISYWWVNISW